MLSASTIVSSSMATGIFVWCLGDCSAVRRVIGGNHPLTLSTVLLYSELKALQWLRLRCGRACTACSVFKVRNDCTTNDLLRYESCDVHEPSTS